VLAGLKRIRTFAAKYAMSSFYPLTISDIRPTGTKAVCISFDVPDNLKEEFTFRAGQYLTLRTSIEGTEVRRAYSICSSPVSGALSVGVKLVEDGLFSIFANQRLQEGDSIEVMPPDGRFTLSPDPTSSGHYLAFAAGSGITPVLSILKTVMEEEPKSTFTLVYGNKTPEEAMFMKEISGLRQLYQKRLVVENIYSKTREDGALFGRIERSTVNYLFKNKLKETQYDKYFLCGPEGMIDTVREILHEKGVSDQDVLFELFTSNADNEVVSPDGGMVKVTITLDEETESFQMSPEQSILQAALDHGIEAPYSCQGGICSTCIAKLTEGKAEMRKNQILTDGELEEGFILTCQAHPTTDSITVDYDDI